MRKVPKIPKIKRKGYQTGTTAAGVEETDEYGNPIPKKEGTGNLGSSLGQSMGWLGYAQQARGLAEANVDYETITDPKTGQQYRQPKTKEGAIVAATAKPAHETWIEDIKSGNTKQLAADIFLTPAGGNILRGKGGFEDPEFEKQRQRINQEQGLESALAARERGETGFTPTETYRKQEQTAKNPWLMGKLEGTTKKTYNAFAKGGEIKGKGTGTSDSINAEVEEGSFVVPAKHAHMGKMIRETLGKKKEGKANLHQKEGVPVKLSDGEILLTKEEKEEIESEMGEEMLEMLAPEAHEDMEDEGMAKGGDISSIKAKKILEEGIVNGKPLTDKQRRYMGWVAGGRKMADGGEVDGIDPKKELAKLEAEEKASAQKRKSEYEKQKAYEAKIGKYKSNISAENKRKAEYDRLSKGIDMLQKEYNEILSREKDKSKRAIGESDERIIAQKKEKLQKLQQLESDREKLSPDIKTPKSSTLTSETKKATTAVKASKITPSAFSTPAVKSAEELEGITNIKAKPSPFNQEWAESLAFKPKTLTEDEINQDIANIYNPNANAIDTVPVTKTEIGMDKPFLDSIAKGKAEYAAENQPQQKTSFWDKVGGINTDNLLNIGLAAGQIGMGLKGLKGERPVAKIDPTFNANVNKAQAQAEYGFTPEQRFLIEQQNQGLLNQEIFAAKNFAGGSAANAYNMTRSAVNNAFTRNLQTASAETELQQQKQAQANQLALQRANMSRAIFDDSLRAFEQKQQAAGQTLGAGINNVLDANRFAQFMKLREQENQFKQQYGI